MFFSCSWLKVQGISSLSKQSQKLCSGTCGPLERTDGSRILLWFWQPLAASQEILCSWVSMEFPIYFIPNSSFQFTNQETKFPLCWLYNSCPRTGDQALLLLPDFMRYFAGGYSLNFWICSRWARHDRSGPAFKQLLWTPKFSLSKVLNYSQGFSLLDSWEE